MIIVCFIYFDNSLFWPLYGYIPNAKTFLFSYVRMKNSPFQVGKYQRKNHRLLSKLCLKFVFIWVPVRTFSTDSTIGISVVLLRCTSSRCIIRALGCCGISAVVYFFASGNFPCKYNNQQYNIQSYNTKFYGFLE